VLHRCRRRFARGTKRPVIDRVRKAASMSHGDCRNSTSGRLRIDSVSLAKLGADGQPGASEAIACDLLLMSGGFTPSVHLFSQSRGKLVYDEALPSLSAGHVGGA